MPRGKKNGLDESALTKGQLRKLNALRKSIGREVGERAFLEWLAMQPEATAGTETDPNAEAIAEAVWTLIEKKGVRIPRGGYVVRRGRGRVVVEAAREE